MAALRRELMIRYGVLIGDKVIIHQSCLLSNSSLDNLVLEEMGGNGK